MMIERNLDREPLHVIVFGSSKATDVIAESTETVKKFRKLVREKECENLKISIIFTEIENELLTSMSNQPLIIIRNCMNAICFENVEDIKFIDIPMEIKKQVKEKNSVGDAFFITDGKVKRVKTVSE